MANVTYYPNCKPLHGTYGFITYKTVNGKCIARRLPTPIKPKNPTQLQYEKWRKKTTVQNLTADIQLRNPNVQDAIKQRNKITMRVSRLYDILSPTISSSIMNAYLAKWPA